MSATLFIRHAVDDYATWKPVYDSTLDLRQRSGTVGASVHRDSSNPNMVVVTLTFGTLAQARDFEGSEELRAAMGRAGVSGPPDFWLTEDIEQTAN
ncbi:hypothetical protein HNQ07_004431 [Deinococcus metalli]|uniref:Cyclase n=1 Tax=Deinococcus metalli TaxID=1141878 RepID=A0A7W8KIQ0_9DEIO|nr:cyclase [Deinococcus metalli]MBB5378924.1 hypothetical protein [Deinococcus metalli]GHF62789.1 hypothetical protein GCM10017781_43510 [Deinococcus metalli]